ncbi:MAG: phosphatase PAP2 family protein [Actinobacteria bacterium]|nr:phosphatase PAP2 family protein [Actinomycetota bacterium]
MDYRIYHAVNEFAVDFKWLAHATYFFETVGVVLYGLAVLVLWLATAPGEERRWKLAALAGGASAGLSLLINQVIGNLVWHRPRPYETHPQVYHLSHSHDPSFPSDHASAAFGIAFGIYFVDRRVGRFFIVVATLIATGRVLVGAHYLTDVLASLVVSVISAYLIVRLGRPLLDRCVRLLERFSDPVVGPVHKRWRRRSLATR